MSASLRLQTPGCAEDIVHEAQTVPRLEPGLEQWLPLWLHWRPHLSQIRAAVAAEIDNLVVDAEDEMRAWFCSLKPHVQKAYGSTCGQGTVKVPVIQRLAKHFGWVDMEIFNELKNAFPLLGPLRRGLGWRVRKDAKYASPTSMEQFLSDNCEVVKRKLRDGKVHLSWEIMAKEIADDVLRGRMVCSAARVEQDLRPSCRLRTHSNTSSWSAVACSLLLCFCSASNRQ